MADELLDSIQSPVATKLPGSPTKNALKIVLGANCRFGVTGGFVVVPIGAQGGGAPRHSRVDVFFDDVLDVVCSFWSVKFM